MKSEFLKFQDKIFVVKRLLREDLNPNVDAWKEYLRADTVLKKDGVLYFLETIPDLEIIEEFK